MKRLLLFVLTFVTVLCSVSCSGRDPQAAEKDVLPEPVLTELKSPIGEYYGTAVAAKSIWTMKVFDGKLYLGCGDGNGNTYPTPVFAYDLATEGEIPLRERFTLTGELEEEYIARFSEMDGKLIALGADPAYDIFTWNEGTYYTLTEKGWQVTVFDSGPHTHDFITVDGVHFIAKQTLYQGEPVISSQDGGKTWQNVSLYKDGVRQTWEAESYITGEKFITLNGKLYLYFYNSGKELGYHHFLYEYKDGAFHQMKVAWPDKLNVASVVPNLSGGSLHSAVEFCGKVYFATGHLYESADLSDISRVTLPVLGRVQEVLVRENKLYVMTSTASVGGVFDTCVFVSEDGESFKEAARFSYALPCYCFEVYDKTLYFGVGVVSDLGQNTPDHEKLGTVLSFPDLSA